MGREPIVETRKEPKRLLNPASGFLEGYTYTLNPYAGCTFACSYCYVRQMPVALFRGMPWGGWVEVKTGAGALLRRELKRAKAKGPVTIFCSSSTDPYQPAEAKEGVMRALLEAMMDEPPDFLLLQTRSPLVTRDIDLLRQLGERVRVSVTVETDLEPVRRAFTPYAPPIQGRLAALRRLAEAGVPTQAAVAPVLPSSPAFAERLAAVVPRVVVDDYFMGDGSGGRRTAKSGVAAIYASLGCEAWYRPDAYVGVLEAMREAFPPGQVKVSRDGFLP
ncbi:hypothetical protein J31TS4_31650 [Paenibacillus sp. J31TS4]|uniref:SPL family radical SAM protein n=1 Tax=Paenibacillus sp. J31TS4 TaxID=2807195 RepID=UPI001B06B11A|nr:radical SAM protein [Paenibacillus sp. J31TS4]GIP39885.1 hypothetical protein J31TS4_31650 [Paenibacillus sp. J31TS4]